MMRSYQRVSRLAMLLLAFAAAAMAADPSTKLVGTPSTNGANQGWSVALSGDGNTAVVGGPLDNNNTGAAWVFTHSGQAWTQATKIVPAGAAAGDAVGIAVAISGDGNTIALGAVGTNNLQGAIYVYVNQGGSWVPQGNRIVASDASSAQSRQGWVVSLSYDGNTLAFGGPPVESNTEGACWVYGRSGGPWSEQQKFGSQFVTGMVGVAGLGDSVALSGDGNTLLCGGQFDNMQTGAVWAFSRTAPTTWVQTGSKLVGQNGRFEGFSVTLNFDGTVAAFGGQTPNLSTFSFWIYSRSGSTWSPVGNPVPGFGDAVALSSDGNTLVAGDHNHANGVGQTNVFVRIAGGGFILNNTLVGTGAIGNAQQGPSVAISSDGSVGLAGGIQDNAGEGAAWVFAPLMAPAPVITSVSTITTLQNQTITISGSGFGTHAPYNGDSAFLSITDTTLGFEAGLPGDGNTLNVTSWTDTQITIAGFTGGYTINPFANLRPGDQVQVSVSNAQTGSGPTTATVTVSTTGAPRITSISPIRPQQTQIITITGSGFGNQAPFSGDSSFLLINDFSLGWNAGFVNASNNDGIGVNVTSWTDSQIVIGGFTGLFGQFGYVLNAGDVVRILVWNAQTGIGPVEYDLTVGTTTSAALSITSSHTGNFAAGLPGVYTVTVSNAASAGPASGTVTVTETLPAGLTLVSMSGSGWSCTGTSCTRSDGLAGGASYPPITVVVNVAANATSPLVNQVSVSGGGSGTASAMDSTVVGVSVAGQTKLVGSPVTGVEGEGDSVGLSADGNTAVLGAPYDNINTGAAWVFVRSGQTWTQQTKLVPSGAAPNSLIGASVAISGDGNTIALGGYQANNGQGATYIFVRQGASWVQQGNTIVAADAIGNAIQGAAVALSNDGNTLAIGGPSDNQRVGACWIFVRSGSQWSEQQKLGAQAIMGMAGIGNAVALSGDGNTALCGGPYDDFNTGAVWSFSRTGTTWTQTGPKIVDPNGTYEGSSVALNFDGTIAAFGGSTADYSNTSFWTYSRSGLTWTPVGNPTIGYGSNVALSSDGSTLLAGPGITSVFTRGAGGVYGFNNALLGAGSIGMTYQGSALALSSDGSVALSGAPYDNNYVGAAWVFTPLKPPAPTITSVSTITAQQTQTITISGHGFGSQAPYNGDSAYLSIQDITTGYSFGATGNPMNLNVTSWTDSQITIAGFTGGIYTDNPLTVGDVIQVLVANPQSPYVFALSNTTVSAAGAPTITSVSPILPQQTQTITINGSGFGTHAPFNGNSSFLKIDDFSMGWAAGYNAGGENDGIGLNVTSWTDTQIVISGFTGAYGQAGGLTTGDFIGIRVWNAQTGIGPRIYVTNVGSNTSAALSVTSTHTGNFAQGQQGATYTVTVLNGASAGPTSGTVTVTETLPAGLTLVSMSGPGWTCAGASCSRSDALAAASSFQPITVTVNVAANATSPLVNRVSVSGGGSATANATDSTVIAATVAGQTKLVGTPVSGTPLQGYSVAISADGNTAVMGGPSDNNSTGAAWVFVRSGQNWTQQAKLVPAGAAANDQIGLSVAISGDGSTIALGAEGTNSFQGATYVYVNQGGTWVQQANVVATDAIGNAQQGLSVALSHDGNTLAYGGPGDNNNAGAGWIFTRSGGQWTEQQKVAGQAVTGIVGVARLGARVALSGDGNTLLCTGPGDNFGTGAVWGFSRTGTGWVQTGPKLVVPNGQPVAARVTTNSDGTIAVIGGSTSDISTSSFWVYSRSGLIWTPVGNPITGYGSNVALSSDGSTLLVGDLGLIPGFYVSGLASNVFTRSAGGGYTFSNSVVVAGGVGATFEGWSVAVSADGSVGLVGGDGDNNDVGAAWVFAPLKAPLPTITSVSTITAQQTQTITITGSGFGAQAPYNGDSPFLAIRDALGFSSGFTGDSNNLNVTSWTDSQITIAGITGTYGGRSSLGAGDEVHVLVANPQNPEGFANAFVRVSSSGAPTITSVSAILPQQTQTITITGSGFGTRAPFNGDSSFLEIADLSGRWNAGYMSAGNQESDGITLNVTSWTDSQIVISGFTGAYSPGDLQTGDLIVVLLWNAQTGIGPRRYFLMVGSTTPAALSISSTHTGNFNAGQPGATYTVLVSNGASAGPSSGTVTVTETLPAGLTLVSMSGPGWSCAGASCSRSDALAAASSFPPITVTVNVAANATSPLVNQVSVSGGGSATASAMDSTVIVNPATLSVSSSHSGSFTQGQLGATYKLTVSNAAAAGSASGTVTVTETLPTGLTLVSMAGTGWTCAGTSCTRSDALAGGASYPPITVTVNVAANATSPVVNQVSVSGGGSATATATDSTVVATTVPGQTKLVGSPFSGAPQQGFWVVLSGDGNTAVVAGPYDSQNTGAAWVFVRSGHTWSQQAKLVPAGAAANAFIASGLAISGDGNTIALGALGTNSNQGATYIFVKQGTSWVQQGNVIVATDAVGKAEQGFTVALSNDGNTLGVGGPADNSQEGACWVFARSGSQWSEQQKLGGSAVTGVAGAAELGFSIALSGDGNTLLCGGIYDNFNTGAVWGFNRTGNTWTQTGPKIVGPNGSYEGYQVTLNFDGTIGAFGGYTADGKNSSVWTYSRSGLTWTALGNPIAGYGIFPALSADGSTLIAGFPTTSVFTRGAGGVYVFNNTVLGDGDISGLSQGSAVAISADGSVGISSDQGENNSVGAAWVFDPLKASAPTITSVSSVTAQQTQIITISGHGFGSQAPYNGDSPYLLLDDNRTDFHMGYTGDSIHLNVTSWTDSQITIAGFTGNYGQDIVGSTLQPGDALEVLVANPQNPAGYANSVVTVSSAGAPTITSVSPILPQQTQTITINGSGFGTHAPYDGDTSFLSVQDASAGWAAGFNNQFNAETIHLNVTSWTDSQIVISGFTGAYGQGNFLLHANNTIRLLVWNAQSGIGPSEYDLTVGSTTPAALSVTSTHTGNFTQGQQGATYTLNVSNGASAGPTSGTVTVTETLPAGLTLVSMGGSGWSCAGTSCTRSDGLAKGASFAPITVTVNVAASAVSPLVNQVSVSGGGSASATAMDSTTLAVSVTLQTNPTGLQVSVDGGSPLTTPQTITLTGGSHQLSVVATQSGPSGTRYLFTGWNDATTGTTDSINVTGSATFTANFKTQYQLTISGSPANGGSVTPPSGGFYDSGAAVPVTATANSGFTFGNWTGSVASTTSASTTVTMSAPETVVANFLTPGSITIATNPPGLQFSIDGGTPQTAPQNLTLPSGSHTIAVQGTQSGGAGTQYVFTGWSDNGAMSHSITVGTTSAIYTATFKTQYQLAISASPAAGGTVTPASGTFYDAATVVPVTATAATGFVFGGWTGSVAGATSASTSVTMSAPQTVVANFTAGQKPSAVTVFSPTQGATGVSTSVSLSWSAAAGATSYDILFGTSTTPPVVDTTTGLSYSPLNLAPNTTYFWSITAKNSFGGTPSALWFFTTGASTTTTSGYQFVPVTPCRIIDTRGAVGPFGGPAIPAQGTRTVAIPQSACNIPATALAYSLNVTVVPVTTLTYLSIWPAGQSQPVVSTLNSFDGSIVANAAIVPAGTQGAISVFASDATQAIIDINGYFAPATTANSMSFYSLTPCRVVDTRGAIGPLGGPVMSGGSARSFPVSSSPCGAPNTAQAYSLNITVVPRHTLGYLTSWPTGQTQPVVSTLNSPNGLIVANAAIVPAGTGGAISIFVTDDTDVIIDINGYFALPGSPAAQSLYTVTPCRVADTRGGSGLASNGSRSFSIPTSPCS
ncbi:MAG TPA: hypothetical protein VKU01_03855, partial [Bryobacteraceae bacterium]|nr:hypothetical protein [Bryobacteraceae bacterium]